MRLVATCMALRLAGLLAGAFNIIVIILTAVAVAAATGTAVLGVLHQLSPQASIVQLRLKERRCLNS